MNTISLRTNHTNDVTVISNIFIDNYMPTANGAYVKVYLYLLRCLSNQLFENLSISTIADRLDDTEKDILRAITYWEKVHLITVSRDERNIITNITFNSPSQFNEEPSMADTSSENKVSTAHPITAEDDTIITAKTTQITHFDKPTYTKAQISELTKDNTVKLIMGAVESYMQRPLKPTDLQLILYLYEGVGFSADLIMFLYEHCISNGKKSSNYIEAVALSWANEGIDTEEKARLYTNQYNKTYQAINKAFGLNRALGDIEIQFITRWIMMFSMPLELIIEACNRTLMKVNKPDFKYADRILDNWASKKVKTLDDVKRLDEAFMKQNPQIKTPTSATNKAPTNKFNNFTQRNYTKEDFQKMEQLLLKKQ